MKRWGGLKNSLRSEKKSGRGVRFLCILHNSHKYGGGVFVQFDSHLAFLKKVFDIFESICYTILNGDATHRKRVRNGL